MAMPQDLATSPEGDVSVIYDSDVTWIRLEGEVDLALAEGLEFAAEQAILRGSPVRVDVSGLEFLDSTGLRLVARLAASERRAGRRRLRVDGVGRLVQEILDVSGLSPILDLKSRPEIGHPADDHCRPS